MPSSRAVRPVMPMRDIPLAYPIFVERDALHALGDVVHAHAPAHRIAIVADATVAQLHGDAIRAAHGGRPTELVTVPPGEREKTRERWAQTTDALFELEFGRDTTIVAFGGGVVCDLAGFVAATFMRGVPVVQVPTTLLSMVDASVGGKTGVDTPAGKNLVGAFYDPRAVVIDPSLLRTLPQHVFRDGLAEMIKHGVIADAKYFADVERELPELSQRTAHVDALTDLIAGSVRIKARVVGADRTEQSLRQVLNFGHTIAHALETLADYTVSHGDAVAVGMVVEARIGEQLKVTAPGTSARIVEALRAASLPASVSELSISPELKSRLTPAAVVEATRLDKKVRAGSVRYALPRQIGEMESADGRWSVPVVNGVVESVLA